MTSSSISKQSEKLLVLPVPDYIQLHGGFEDKLDDWPASKRCKGGEYPGWAEQGPSRT